jgi:hypothetical protein
MTHQDISIEKATLAGLFSQPNAIAELLQSLLNQVLQSQMDEHLNANKHERNAERVGFRNGNRPRKLYTRVGTIELLVPQTRDGSFCTELFKRYQRSEQAFVLGLMEMYVQGVSTRKVANITEALCGVTFSKSTVSNLCVNLDARVNAFRTRPLDGEYPVLMVDAMYVKARNADDSRVLSRAVLIMSAIRSDGFREIVGVETDCAENAVTWTDALKRLKSRGLKGVQLVVSDAHDGLIEAVKQTFNGATWQRCQVHLMRNIAGHTAAKHKAAVMAAAKLVFEAADMTEARRHLAAFSEAFNTIAPKAVVCMEDGFDDAVAVLHFPLKYRKRWRSTNMQERLNEEVRRRERVIRIFPNDEAVMRLVGAVLADINEQWSERKYLDMDEFVHWRAAQTKNNALILSA